MLSISDVDISEVSSKILGAGYDVAFLVPTKIGLDKSILDAHESLRSFLKRSGVHDYSLQAQGTGSKVLIEAEFITHREVFTVKVSMYRPETKKGDPRIWVYRLKDFVQAGNLIALIVVDNKLHIINCSNELDLSAALDSALPRLSKFVNPIAEELLGKLKFISRKGFIPTVTKGDTGVGMTLEAELDIAANSSRLPDYKGIEIKSSRVDQKNKQRNRHQLFSSIPSWKLSRIKSASELILARGYIDEKGSHALRATISASNINPQGLFFDIDYVNSHLRQCYKDVSDFSVEHDVSWLIADLKEKLLKKHKETFWVKARHNDNRADECFHYVEVEHTQNPYIENFETLIETGIITLDYTMHIKPNGKVRDHGYLFKLKQGLKASLFPEAKVYNLLE